MATVCNTEGAGIQLLMDEPLPDPILFRHGDNWYMTGTLRAMFSSETLAPGGWEMHPLDFDMGDLPPVQLWGFSMWADPDGNWHGYGTIHYGFFRTVIGHFLPQEQTEEPPVRWRFNRILIGNVLTGEFNMYDQRLHEHNGEIYLLYSANPRPHTDIDILIQRMLDPQTIDPDWPPRVLLRPEDLRSEERNPGYLRIVEGAKIHEINGRYLMMYSTGDYARDNYTLGMAWSDTFLPPPGETYRKVFRPDPDNVWGNPEPTDEVHYLLQSLHPEWPNYTGEHVRAPGIGNLVEENGQWFLVFHAYPADQPRWRGDRYDPSRRMVFRVPVTVQVEPGIPPAQWIIPHF